MCTAEYGTKLYDDATGTYWNWNFPSKSSSCSQPANIQWHLLTKSRFEFCPCGCWLPQPEQGPGGPSILTSSDLFMVTWAPEGILITYTAPNTQKPFSFILHFHLINTKVKTPTSLESLNSALNGNFFFFSQPDCLFSGWSCKHCWQIFLNASNIFSLSTSLMYKIWQPGSYRPPASLSPWQQWKTIHDPIPWSPVSMQLICPKPLSLMEE